MMWFCRSIQLRTPLVPILASLELPQQPGTLCACEVWALQAASEADGWEVPFLFHREFINLGFFFGATLNCNLPLSPIKHECSALQGVLIFSVSKSLSLNPPWRFCSDSPCLYPEQMIPKAIIRKQALKHSTGAHLLRVVAGGTQRHKIVLQVSKKKKKRQNPHYFLLAWSVFVLQQNYLSLSAKITSS